MAMPLLIIHAGPHKTGSTSVQAAIHAARHALSSDGVDVPPASAFGVRSQRRATGLKLAANLGWALQESEQRGNDSEVVPRAARLRDFGRRLPDWRATQAAFGAFLRVSARRHVLVSSEEVPAPSAPTAPAPGGSQTPSRWRTPSCAARGCAPAPLLTPSPVLAPRSCAQFDAPDLRLDQLSAMVARTHRPLVLLVYRHWFDQAASYHNEMAKLTGARAASVGAMLSHHRTLVHFLSHPAALRAAACAVSTAEVYKRFKAGGLRVALLEGARDGAVEGGRREGQRGLVGGEARKQPQQEREEEREEAREELTNQLLCLVSHLTVQRRASTCPCTCPSTCSCMRTRLPPPPAAAALASSPVTFPAATTAPTPAPTPTPRRRRAASPSPPRRNVRQPRAAVDLLAVAHLHAKLSRDCLRIPPRFFASAAVAAAAADVAASADDDDAASAADADATTAIATTTSTTSTSSTSSSPSTTAIATTSPSTTTFRPTSPPISPMGSGVAVGANSTAAGAPPSAVSGTDQPTPASTAGSHTTSDLQLGRLIGGSARAPSPASAPAPTGGDHPGRTPSRLRLRLRRRCLSVREAAALEQAALDMRSYLRAELSAEQAVTQAKQARQERAAEARHQQPPEAERVRRRDGRIGAFLGAGLRAAFARRVAASAFCALETAPVEGALETAPVEALHANAAAAAVSEGADALDTFVERACAAAQRAEAEWRQQASWAALRSAWRALDKTRRRPRPPRPAASVARAPRSQLQARMAPARASN